MLDVILIPVIATLLICGATLAIPVGAWLDEKLEERSTRR
jgi:hypothetical protein